MSKSIESKVVEMRFDNKHFESHAKESLSTLDKLKEKLNLKGAAKGLENINASANKVNMNGMSSALDTVHSKFSALEIMGVTALANITNSAVNAGKRLISALTIDPVRDGFNEYEMTLNAVQTTMAATGKTAKEVEEELKRLDEYADKTVYSTADMLNNLPKFTNAGVELEAATTAMIGIANATALAGGDANKASIAFYNLGQAIGTGYLTRMDYNSINNAGIATMEWKNQMVEAAIAAGTLTEVEEGLYDTGSQVLTLQQLFIDGLQDQWATTDVMMKVFQDYGDETTEIGKKAYSSAQDIKTFSQMMESLKATAGTGWKDTWQIIFGDLDEAKEFWTGLTNFISNIITGMADFRNKILDSALGRSFKGLLDNIKKPFKEIEKTVSTIKDYTKVVDEIIAGKWGNTEKRWNALTAAGYDWAHAQNLVNEKLGFSLRRATSYNETQAQTVKNQEQVTETTTEYILELMKLSDAQLRAKGYTDEQIEAFKELKKVSKQTGIPLKEFIENIDEIDGRWILINSFKNIGQGLVAVFKAMKDAWLDIFPVSGAANGLFNIIAAFHKFTTYLTVGEEAADKLKRTFKGLFAILDIILTIIAGPIKIAFKIFLQLLNALDIGLDGVLTFTAKLGDAIVEVHSWFESIIDFSAIFEYLAPYIKKAAKALGEWLKKLKNSEIIKNFTKRLTNAKEALMEWLKGLKEADNIPKYILEGLVNGLKNGVGIVVDTMIELGKKILEAIRKVLGIHSPSTEFFEIGKNIIQGLINGVQNGLSGLWNLFKNIGAKCIELLSKIDFGKILAAGIGIGMLVVFKNLINVLDKFTAPLEGLGNMFDGIGEAFEGLGKSLKANVWKKKSEAIRNIALSIAILAGSVYLLSKIEPGTLLASVAAIAALAVIIGVLASSVSKMDKIGDLGKSSLSFIAVTASLYVLAKSLVKLSSIKPERLKSTLIAFGSMIAGLSAFFILFGTLVKGEAARNIDKAGIMVAKISGSLMLMALAIKLIANISPEDIMKGVTVISAISLLFGGIAVLSRFSGAHGDKAGKMISKMSLALLVAIVAIKLASTLEPEAIFKGLAVIGMLGAFFAALVAVSYFAGKHAAKAGWMMLQISVALAVTVGVIKMISSLSGTEILKAIPVIATLGVFLSALIAVSYFAGKNAMKAGAMLLMISGAVLVLTGVIFLLSKMDGAGLYKALGIVAVLEVLFGGLIFVTTFAKDCMKSLIVITTAITLLIAAVIGLSFIDPARLASAAASISAVMSALALVIASTKFISTTGNLAKSLLPLVGIVGLLGGILFVMSKLDTKKAITNAAGLSMLLLSLTASLVVASLIGSTAMAGIGALALMTLIVAGLAGVLAAMSHFDVVPSMETAKSLSTLLLAMSGALVILGVVGLLGPAAFIGIAALATLIVGIGGLIVGIGALFDKFPILEEFLDKGMPILEKIGYALGSFVGNIVGGFLSGTSNGLPAIGTNLSDFMNNVNGFIEGAKNIDESVVNGVSTLSKAILALTAADLITGIASFISDGVSFAQLGTSLSDFINNADDFITKSANINPKSMEGIKTLAEAIQLISSADLMQSLTSWLTGEASLSEFGNQLSSLGTSLNQFLTSLGTFDEAKLATIEIAAKAIKTLAKASTEIENQGGLTGALFGDNDLGTFGKSLPIIGTGLKNFLTNLGTFDEASLETVKYASKAIKNLAKASTEIENQGGLSGVLFGDNDLGTFGTTLPIIGTGLKNFITNLGTFDDAQVTTVKSACEAIKSLASSSTEIENQGGFLSWIVGDNDLGTFAKNLPTLGSAISSFVTNLGTFTDAQVSTINSACKAINALAKLDGLDTKASGKGLKSLAKSVKSFVSTLGEIGSKNIDSCIKKIKDLADMAKTVASDDVTSLKTFGDSLKSVAKEGVKGFIKAFNGTTPKNDAKKAAKDLVQAAIDGMEDKKKKVKDKATALSEAATDAMYTKTLGDAAKQAGKDLVTGFANGIKNNKKLATDAGSSLGKAALTAAKEAIKSNSPSKEAIKIGNYFGQGLVIGIEDYESKSYHAGYDIADRAKTGLSKAISKVSNLISNGIDEQPTIRPVLDLSDVESGAGYLNSMFNNGPTIGVMSNLNAISNGMNSRSQNGSNGDVVTAINKLRKDLGNVGGTTNNYNVNGVTYDDGSNITDAVRTLVRAAKIERRV